MDILLQAEAVDNADVDSLANLNTLFKMLLQEFRWGKEVNPKRLRSGIGLSTRFIRKCV